MPPDGNWPFRLSRRGYKPKEAAASDPQYDEHWCPQPGRHHCRLRIVRFVRCVTQFARRLETLEDSSRKWLLRATHGSDETRNPFDKRQSAPTSARRMVRGSPDTPESRDLWPGAKASARPADLCPGGEPQAEPESAPAQAVLLKSL